MIKLMIYFLILSFARADEISVAEKLVKAKSIEEAKAKITQYLIKNNTAQAQLAVGNMYARQKVWPEAVHYYEIATNREPKNALAWYQLGIAQHQNNNIDGAVVSLRQSLKLSSTTVKTYLALGEILELNKSRYEARNLYMEAIKKIGPKAYFLSKQCWLDFQEAYWRQAVERCSQASKANAADYVSKTLWAQALIEGGKKPEALKILTETIAGFPEKPLPYRARGLMYFAEKSFEAAAHDLGKAFGLDQYDDEAGIFLARSLFELGQYEHSLFVYIEAIRLNRSFRFELSSRQRDLIKKHKDEIAKEFGDAYDKI